MGWKLTLKRSATDHQRRGFHWVLFNYRAEKRLTEWTVLIGEPRDPAPTFDVSVCAGYISNDKRDLGTEQEKR